MRSTIRAPPRLVDADHRGDVVPHRVHRVVRLVAVERPVARLVGDEVDLPHLAHRDIDGDFGPARARGTGPPSVPVTVNSWPWRWIGWLVMVRFPMRKRTRSFCRTTSGSMPGKDAAVPRPQVEVEHRHDLRREAARIDVVGVEQEAEIAVDRIDLRMLRSRMRDPEAHHAHRHLRHLIGVRVIHERARAPRDELVDEGLAHRMCGCVRPPTPSMPLGTRCPCQCTVVCSGSLLVTKMRTRSPSTTSMVGPGSGRCSPTGAPSCRAPSRAGRARRPDGIP